MFYGSKFLLIKSSSTPDLEADTEIETISKLIEEQYGKIVAVKEAHDNKKNYLDVGERADHDDTPSVTHIITRSIQFIEYNAARKSMIPVTTPDWIIDSVQAGKCLNFKSYNPDPKYFLKDCFVCVADNLPVGDKEVIYAGVKAFGGNYLDVLTKYSTHLIAVDLSNEKSIIASSAISGAGSQDDAIDIKIVLPHWIDHSITLGRKVDEKPYLLPDPALLKSGNSSITSQMNSSLMESGDLEKISQSKSEFLKNKTFYISSDYNLSERLSNTLDLLIEKNGGKVTKSFSSENVDVYIGKYRNGVAYVESSKSNRIIIGNLHWLYSIIVSNEWVLPVNSNLLHYPSPHIPLDGFKDLRISVTNYSGDARAYLSRLITLLGGTFTKSLTKENHYLIAAKGEGKKYLVAKDKWLDENGEPKIKIVNHLWLEECFSKWKFLDDDQQKYKYLGNQQISMESLIGSTKLDENVLKIWTGKDGEEEELKTAKKTNSDNVDDSMSEDESTQSAASSNANKPKVVEPPVSLTSRYGGRSAAKKAALKLQDNMSDLNQYQEIAKSSRKMKSYMEELERTATPTKRKPTNDDDTSDKFVTPLKKKAKAEKTPVQEVKQEVKIVKESAPRFEVIAIMTGCESEITLNRTDLSKLANVGIKVISDFSHKHAINTLIAPKILRTEKFLRSLSQVNKIVHPNYIAEVLEKIAVNETWEKADLFKAISIDDYTLDKSLSVKEINTELGYSKSSKINGLTNLTLSDKHGKLFEGLKLNLSSCLNGGVEVIAKILMDHGMTEFQTIKNNLSGNNLKKALIESSEDGKHILIAHKTKDAKLITAFKKLNLENAEVVEWDWCVKSIFKMQLESYDDYKL
ncbi:regulator of Ty1 transposition [Scheffersomyces xylosifermentans]|uniref:regulator of Ty1 transposition n=1 Tax=Scheffersomyces xylosifermentans TaxID=1304137 RepID=UPI00315DDB32